MRLNLQRGPERGPQRGPHQQSLQWRGPTLFSALDFSTLSRFGLILTNTPRLPAWISSSANTGQHLCPLLSGLSRNSSGRKILRPAPWDDVRLSQYQLQMILLPTRVHVVPSLPIVTLPTVVDELPLVQIVLLPTTVQVCAVAANGKTDTKVAIARRGMKEALIIEIS